jgi:hypothetical protein
MDLDWTAIHTHQAWNLPSLEHIAWNIGIRDIRHDLRYFGPTLQSLSMRYSPVTLHFWEVFSSLRHLCVTVPFHKGGGYINIQSPPTHHPLQRLVLDPRRPINPETETRSVVMNIVEIAHDFLRSCVWVEWVRYVTNERKAEWNPRDWERFRMTLLRMGGYRKQCSAWRYITGWE